MSQSQKFFDEDQKAQDCADKILDNMCSGNFDTAYGEDIWEEVNRILCDNSKQRRMDALEDMTLISIMKKAVERRVKAMIERGDFQ